MAQRHGLSPPRLGADVRRLVIVLMFGAVLPLLDTTIVNVALEDIARQFAVPVTTIQWVVTGYAIAAALAIPVTTWAVARVGEAPMWIASLVVFLVGSVLCGLARNAGSLIAFRVLQGFGGGMSMPVLQTMLIRSAGQQQARQAMAAVGIPAVLAPVLGPLIGGVILADATWPWIFLINVPVCLAALVLAWFGIPRRPVEQAGRLDVPGLLMLSAALAVLVYGFSQAVGPGAAWLAIPGGLALLAVFTVRAARSERVGIVNVRLFARPAFAGAAGSLLLAGVYFYGGLILLPMYCARVAHLSALAVGSVVAVQGVGALVGRSALTRLAPRAGTRPVVLVGVCCAVVATLPFALPGRHPLGLMLAALLLRGAGVGIATVAILGSVYHGLEGADIPHASSMSRIVLQVGGALGVALVSGVLAQALRTAGTEGAFSEPFWWLDAATVIALAPAVLLPGGASRVRAVVYLPRHAQ